MPRSRAIDVRQIDASCLASRHTAEVVMNLRQVLPNLFPGERQTLIAQKRRQRWRQLLLAVHTEKDGLESAARALVSNLGNTAQYSSK